MLFCRFTRAVEGLLRISDYHRREGGLRNSTSKSKLRNTIATTQCCFAGSCGRWIGFRV